MRSCGSPVTHACDRFLAGEAANGGRGNVAASPILALGYPVELRRDRELELLERGLAMRQTAEWFTIELSIPMILAVALLLALIVELALRIE
jgi:hypothetical protein